MVQGSITPQDRCSWQAAALLHSACHNLLPDRVLHATGRPTGFAGAEITPVGRDHLTIKSR